MGPGTTGFAYADCVIREKDLRRQVQTAKDQMRDLHTSNESTQAKLLDASQRQGAFCLLRKWSS